MNNKNRNSHNPDINNRGIERFTLVTDAWFPQINGVVTTLSSLVNELTARGIQVDVIQPNDYPNLPLPSYSEIRMVWHAKHLQQRILEFQPHALHIATEGSLGWMARHIALKQGLSFTSGYHTRYPEYIRARWPIPETFSYSILRRFHNPADTTLVPAASIMTDLENKGFEHLTLMSRGVDKTIFHSNYQLKSDYERPIMLYVGRVAPEKGIEDFLSLNLAGTKLVIGDGPSKTELENKYPDAHFLGVKKGQDLAKHYAHADVFVFPSKTDTFGVVNIEAIACGTPVAAYPVTGPKDIVTPNLNGCLNDNLQIAIEQALQLKGQPLENSIPQYTWPQACQQLINALSLIVWPETSTQPAP